MRLIDAFLAEVKRQELQLPGELVVDSPQLRREGRIAGDLPVEYRKYIGDALYEKWGTPADPAFVITSGSRSAMLVTAAGEIRCVLNDVRRGDFTSPRTIADAVTLTEAFLRGVDFDALPGVRFL